MLGRGGSAVVYRGRHPLHGLLALKVLESDSQAISKLPERFAQEGIILATIEHENVVRYHGSGTEDGRIWILLELVVGQSLRQRIADTNGLIPANEVVRWLLRACDGVAAAHAAGIIHRDLKPSNILITDDGRVKVIDFGLAKLRDFGVKTTNEQRIGTAMYMAPEQAKGAPADPRMDVYAMGMMLYEALTGVHPMGPSPRSTFDAVKWHLTETPRSPRELDPNIPGDLSQLVMEAIEKDPTKRVQTMSDLAKRLREALSRMNAPLRRLARNVLPSGEAALAPTVQMPVVDGPMSAAPATGALSARGTMIMSAPAPASRTPEARNAPTTPPHSNVTSAPVPTANARLAAAGTAIMPVEAPPSTARSPIAHVGPHDRAAILPQPVASAIVVPTATRPDPRREPLSSDAQSPSLPPAERRTTNEPVQSSVAPVRGFNARPLVALVVAGLIAAGLLIWFIIGRAPSPTGSAAAVHPPLPASSVSGSPTGSASAPRPLPLSSSQPPATRRTRKAPAAGQRKR